MPAKVVSLCTEVVSFLNGLTLSQSFTAERYNVWTDDLAEASGLKVMVIPLDAESNSITRTDLERRFRVNIIVQKRLTAQQNTNSEQDELILLSEEIENAIYGETMGQFGFVDFSDNAGTRAVIETDAVVNGRQFRTVLQLSYAGV